MSATTSPFSIEPVLAFWGDQQTDCITAKPDIAGSLEGTSMLFSTVDMLGVITQRYLWLDNGSSVDPAPSGRTGVQVVYAANDTAATLATLCVVALDLVVGVNAKIVPGTTDQFYIQNGAIGAPGEDATDVDTTFDFLNARAGSRLDLGKFDGDVSFSMPFDTKDVTAQQTGTTVVERFITGQNIAAVNFPLKEVKTKINEFIEATGSTVVVGSDTLRGFGSANLFKSTLDNSRRLILHPARILDVSDVSQDYCFNRAYPNIDEINFSGETEQTMVVSYTFLPDQLVRAELEQFFVGRHTANIIR